MGDVRAVPAGDFDYEAGGQGYASRRRVSRGPVVILTFDTEALQAFWLNDYVPEVVAVECGVARLRDALASGEWDGRQGHLRSRPEYIGAVRLVVAR